MVIVSAVVSIYYDVCILMCVYCCVFSDVCLCTDMCLVSSGIGYAMVFISAVVSIYYNMIIAYAMYYMFVSFTNLDDHLPWETCDQWWNTHKCKGDAFPRLEEPQFHNDTNRLNVLFGKSIILLMICLLYAKFIIIIITYLKYKKWIYNYGKPYRSGVLISLAFTYWSMIHITWSCVRIEVEKFPIIATMQITEKTISGWFRVGPIWL